MTENHRVTGWKDKVLFTPGPLTTGRAVKQAMLRDLGSRDFEFIGLVKDIRRRLLELGGVAQGDYAAILMQGSGTFSLESVVSSTISPDGKLRVVINGAYGRRTAHIAEVHGIEVVRLNYPEDSKPDLQEVEAAAVKHIDADTPAPDCHAGNLHARHGYDEGSGIFVGRVEENIGRALPDDLHRHGDGDPLGVKACRHGDHIAGGRSGHGGSEGLHMGGVHRAGWINKQRRVGRGKQSGAITDRLTCARSEHRPRGARTRRGGEQRPAAPT